jgi:WD40 repeat protein
LAISPDSSLLATAGEDHNVALWSLITGKQARTLGADLGSVCSVAFSPDGKLVAAGNERGTAYLLDSTTGQEKHRVRSYGLISISVAFAPDGKTLATTSRQLGSTVHLWDVASGKELHTRYGHTDAVIHLRFASDKRSLTSIGRDWTALTWDRATYQPRRRQHLPAEEFRADTALSADGRVMAFLCAKETVCVWDLAAGRELQRLKSEDGTSNVALTPDGKQLAWGHTTGTVSLWDVASGRELRKLAGGKRDVQALVFAPDGKVLAAHSADGVTRLWQVATGTEQRTWGSPFGDGLIFSPDGQLLAEGNIGRTRTVVVREVATGTVVRQLDAWAPGHVLAFSADGRYIAANDFRDFRRTAGTVEFSARVVEMSTGEEVRRFVGHADSAEVSALAFAPDNRTFASGGTDGTVLLWDLAGTPSRTPLTAAELQGHWEQLRGDAASATKAVWRLAAVPRQAAPFLKERLRPVVPAKREQVMLLLARLKSKQFKEREAALDELHKLGESALTPVYEVLDMAESVEERRRLQQLVASSAAFAPVEREQVRTERAVAVLEYAATPETRKLLAELAAGEPRAQRTRAARAALARVAQQAAALEKFPPELVRFVPYKENPIFTAAPKGSWDSKIRERGWIIREDGLYKLYYTGYDGTKDGLRMLGLATSKDGIHWTRHPRNPLYRAHWVEDMMVVKHEGKYYMFAEGKDDLAHLLVSSNGLDWTRVGLLDIRLKNGKPIPSGPYGTPTVWLENGTWYLFYERYDKGVWLATSTDRKVWTNVQDEPVLSPGPGEHDKDMIALNQIIKHKGRYYAYYHGCAKAGPKARLWSTSVATSTDLIHWEKYPGNPLQPVEQDKSSGIVVHDGERWRLYTMHPEVNLHLQAP